MQKLNVGATCTLAVRINDSLTTFTMTIESEESNGNVNCSFYSDGQKRFCVVPAYWLSVPQETTPFQQMESFGGSR
jgi:hypothetical protein